MKYVGLIILAFVLVGCNNQQKPTVTAPDTNEAEDQIVVAFKNVEVEVEGRQIHLTGEANADNNGIFYQLTQGEKVLEKETDIILDDGKFDVKFMLSKDAAEEEEAPIIMLYGKGSNGDEINPNYIPVNVINY